MKKGSLMFSVEISHNILSYAPTRRGLRGGEIFDIAICEVKRRKGGLDLALADAPRRKFFFCTYDTGISMKTKERCGKVGLKRECS
jgi:hypothetical protein